MTAVLTTAATAPTRTATVATTITINEIS